VLVTQAGYEVLTLSEGSPALPEFAASLVAGAATSPALQTV
jgi:hypothetical protein